MTSRRKQHWQQQIPLLLLLWVWFATRLHALESLPLHNDEGLHLTRAVEVWSGHPFWDITDGKIINHWPIALAIPQGNPVWAVRYPTLLLAVLGLSAGLAWIAHHFGRTASQVAGVVALLCGYLFFYERLGQSDAEAGALVMVALWACTLFLERNAFRWALICGGALALAVLFKFTAAPYALVITLWVIAAGNIPVWRRVQALLAMGAIGVAALAVPVLYLYSRGQPFFQIALRWIGSDDAPLGAKWPRNLAHLIEALTSFGRWGQFWLVCVLVGWIWLLTAVIGWRWRVRWRAIILFIPPALIVILSGFVYPRHYVVTLLPLVLLTGAGWAHLLHTLPRIIRWPLGVAALVLCVANFSPFALRLYVDPTQITPTMLPALTQREYYTDHGSGFGLREAMLALPQTVAPDVPLIASMFPASCRRANFYAPTGYLLTCTDVPGLTAIQAALAESNVVYVLIDRLPGIGVSLEALPGAVTILGRYPRPSETESNAAIMLVKITP
ncbi:MAG: ArnT family glycosyltransferase [Phototrophicaceae bacterium]|jgi:hypothetical protein